MTENCEFEAVSWENMYSMLLKLAENIRKDSFCPDLIVGVCRGGWLPARVLSDLLGNPNMASVRVELYSDVAKRRKKPRVTQSVSVRVQGKSVLVVDDVTDTGKSLSLIKSYLTKSDAGQVKLATLYHKPWSIITPDYYARKTRRWIVFPWEIRETIRSVIKKYQRQGKAVMEAKLELVRAGLSHELVEYFAKRTRAGED